MTGRRSGPGTPARRQPPAGARLVPCGDGVVERRVERHGLVEASDLEQAADAGLRAHEAEVAVVGPSPLERAHDRAEPRGIEEVDPLEIEDQAGKSLPERRNEGLRQPW